MTHPLIEELLEPSRNLVEARDELAPGYARGRRRRRRLAIRNGGSFT